MTKLRQLPEVYLRGALANETMKNLTIEQQSRVSVIVDELRNSQALAGHQQEFINSLRITIGGDYRDDKDIAIEEYNIALWRAVVYLLYHSNYNYQCGNCGQVGYQTQRGKFKKFDRRYPICPACRHIKVVDPETYINYDNLQDEIEASQKTPEHVSPIIPIPGAKKITKPEKILNDQSQLEKFITTFIWNYFRQILNENHIRMHRTESVLVRDAADVLAVDEIIGALTKYGINHEYFRRTNPQNGYYRIYVNLSLVPPELTYNSEDGSAGELVNIIAKYKKLGVEIKITQTEILVKNTVGAQIIETFVSRPEIVRVTTSAGSIDEEEGYSSVYDALNHKIVKGPKMGPDNIERIEIGELLSVIRDSLPWRAKPVFDIITETGEVYAQYSASKYGKQSTGQPRQNHIARFLGMSPREVSKYITDIRVQCMLHDLPSEVG